MGSAPGTVVPRHSAADFFQDVLILGGAAKNFKDPLKRAEASVPVRLIESEEAIDGLWSHAEFLRDPALGPPASGVLKLDGQLAPQPAESREVTFKAVHVPLDGLECTQHVRVRGGAVSRGEQSVPVVARRQHESNAR